MKERPIIFSGPMVRAILDGRKTQTRRAVKPQSAILTDDMARSFGIRPPEKENLPVISPPHGIAGDRLWVKETWRLYDSSTECACYDYCTCSRFHGKPIYKASQYDLEGPWRSPVSMPRWVSRITLEITDVRVERLNDISERDCLLEGFDYQGRHKNPWYEFMDHWESLHGPGSWAANPWVWVYTFKMVDK